MKKLLAVLTAALLTVFFLSAVAVNALDPVISPTATIYPDGPTGTTRATTGTTIGGGGATTVTPGGGITTAKPGEPQTLKPGDGDNATGGESSSTTGKDGETSTAKPDDSDTSPDTGLSVKWLGSALILMSGMAVAALVEPGTKKSAKAN